MCDDAAAIVDAVARLNQIEPSSCRQRATDFGVDTMCARYQLAYEALLDRKRPTATPMLSAAAP